MTEKTAIRTVGQQLREGRESRGLELRDIAARTKIQVTTLQHIEDDRFAELPAEVLARGFVKSFAKELQLDADAILIDYRRQTGSELVTIPVVAYEAAERSHSPSWLDRVQKNRRIVSSLAMAAAVVALALIVLVLSGGSDANTSASYQPQDDAEAWQPVPAGADDWQTYREN